MNAEIQQIWHEILADYTTSAALWQLLIIILALGIAWAVNGALKAYLIKQFPDTVKPVIGGINRILFPITAFLMVAIARFVFDEWMHVGILRLASRLLLAMVAVRLIVYALRYIFSPSGWLKTLEQLIAWAIWGILALHLSGMLPQITNALEEITFNIGKNQVNLLVVLQALLTVITTIFIALWLSRLLENKLMRTEQVSLNMRVVMVKLVRIVFVFLAILFALSAVGLDITLLSVFGGALGVGLGFGLQKIASNYVSGFIILLDKSMSIGDVVTIDKHQGVIQDMRSRYMVLKKMDGTNVIIPNEILITNSAINHSMYEHRGRAVLQMAISYDSDLNQAIQLMKEIMLKPGRVLQTPEPVVNIKGFNESGIELNAVVWVADPENPTASLQSDLYLAFFNTFKLNNIKLVKLENKTE